MGNPVTDFIGKASGVNPVIAGVGAYGVDQYFAGQRADIAYRRQRQLMEDRYILEMRGMKRAGLNPMLMATKGASPIPNVAMAQPGTQAASSLASTAAAAKDIEQVDKIDKEIDNIIASTELTKEQAQNARQIWQKLVYDTSLSRVEWLQQEEVLKGLLIEGKIDGTRYGELTRALKRINPFIKAR